MRRAGRPDQWGLYLREYNSGPPERQRIGGSATAALGASRQKIPAARCRL